MSNYPQNLQELQDLFESEQACIQYLATVKWPEGFRCERCQHTEFWIHHSSYTCRAYRTKINLLAGKIFQDTKLPLRTWFRVIWDIVRKKVGASAISMETEFGVSYKTAWSMSLKLRRAMVDPGRSKLNGTVEVDETFIGSLEEGMPGRGSHKKALVLIGVELNQSNAWKDPDGQCRFGRRRQPDGLHMCQH